MKNLKFNLKFIINIIIFISFFSTIEAKNSKNFNEAEDISNYFSGIVSINENEYKKSYNFLKPLSGLEDNHYIYSRFFQYSLVTLNKFSDAISYSKRLENKKIDNFESNLISALYHLKFQRYEKAERYFKKLEAKTQKGTVHHLISNSLNNWLKFTSIKNLEDSIKLLEETPERFTNIKNIQKTFLHCYFDSPKTDQTFNELTANSDVDYSRYFFFHANYFVTKNNYKKASKVLENSLNLFPRNLILNQLKSDLESKKNFTNQFDCKNPSHIIAEIFYITASSLSSQGKLASSNFYLSLAKYLNPNFVSFDTLQAENFYNIEKYKTAENIYRKIQNKGSVYNWYSTKRIASILIEQDRKQDSVRFMNSKFNEIKEPSIYEIFDYAVFLKNNEKYKDAIKHYSIVLKNIDKEHFLYAKTTDGRGVSFERTKQWNKAEKDLLNSLSIEPESAYVINYLAYSWIEQGKNIEKALDMLKKANKIKPNNGYITDSLGWALFKLENYEESKKYLEMAVRLMPYDPVVSDHYADVLWMNNKPLQARYIWNHVLNFKETEKKLKKKVERKLLFGLKI